MDETTSIPDNFTTNRVGMTTQSVSGSELQGINRGKMDSFSERKILYFPLQVRRERDNVDGMADATLADPLAVQTMTDEPRTSLKSDNEPTSWEVVRTKGLLEKDQTRTLLFSDGQFWMVCFHDAHRFVDAAMPGKRSIITSGTVACAF
jgi:hypothetical protein